MALNPAAIHIGMARVFLGCTAPLPGTEEDPEPSLTEHDNGVPETGVEVGYTSSPSNFTYRANKQEVEAEQSLNPIDVFVVTEECTLEFTAMEHTYNTLKTAFDNVGTMSDDTIDLFYGGDGAGLVTVKTQCIVLTSRIRNDPTKFEVLTVYKVYNVEGIVVSYGRTSVAEYKVTLKGLVDANRPAGDRLFQFYKEKSIPATGATAGVPGTFTPVGSTAPANLGFMTSVVASPNTAWTVGQHVVLLDASQAYWNSTAWVAGAAP